MRDYNYKEKWKELLTLEIVKKLVLIIECKGEQRLFVLQESPFTDQGSVVEIFTDLTVWMGIRKVIDSINANAAA